jgi:hypothetical protein
MNEISLQDFARAIEASHGAKSHMIARERVHERLESGETVWIGEVLIFEVIGTGQRVYAWEVDGEVTAVLGEGPVKCAADAVRAAIAEGGR